MVASIDLQILLRQRSSPMRGHRLLFTFLVSIGPIGLNWSQLAPGVDLDALHLDRWYNSIQYWQSIMPNAQAVTAHCLKWDRDLELLLLLQLQAGSGACDVGRYLPDCCWGAEKTACWSCLALLLTFDSRPEANVSKTLMPLSMLL